MANSHDEFADKQVTVMGLGGFGGAVGAVRWLASQGADLLVTDRRHCDELASSVDAIAPLIDSGQVTLRLGEHNVSDFTGADLIVVNPAVATPWDNRFLRAARAAGVPLSTEIRMLIERLPSRDRVIGVTGSAGKSTTSAMIHCILSHALTKQQSGANAWFGGNIGGSLLMDLDQVTPEDWVVLELSSAQLHWLRNDAGRPGDLGWSPHVAVVSNFAPNHLDWHGTLDHYQQSKAQILHNQRAGDVRILPIDLMRWHADSHTDGAIVRTITRADADRAPKLRIPGAHNTLNAAFALEVADALGIDRILAAEALEQFHSLRHRLEPVGSFALPSGGSVRAFNDSKCTTPEACALALMAFSTIQGEGGTEHVRLICGGYDKKLDLASMAQAASVCAAVYTIGATGLALAQEITAAGGRATCRVNLDDAVAAACTEAVADDVILLSPGCASWDQFVSYEHRGEQFAAAIQSQLGPASHIHAPIGGG